MKENGVGIRCARCVSQNCRDGEDCFGVADEHRRLYSDARVARLHRAATAIEARHYPVATRLEEVIAFAKELGAARVGLAFCIGLSEEARLVDDVLRQHFDVVSVCCKACGINKKEFGLEQIDPDRSEVICNPAGQASLMNAAGTEVNVILGLCVGHDAIFSYLSEAPVTTLAAKDRVLAHNPLGAIYSRYLRRRFAQEGGGKEPDR